MSVPSKHDKERLCTLTSLFRAQGLAGVLFCFFSTDFVSDQSESGASAREHPVVMGRMLLAESFPYLPEGGLHPDKPQALPLVGAGAGWG